MPLAAPPGIFDHVWIASLGPPLSVRAEGSEERTLLYACARFDRFAPMHLVRRTLPVIAFTFAGSGCAASDADPPRLFELEEPFPETEPISDARCRRPGTPIGSNAPTGGCRFARFRKRPDSDLSGPGCLFDHPVRGGRFYTQSASHRVAPPRPRRSRMWTPARASTPRASIVHPFVPSSPAVPVKGPTRSSGARSHRAPVFRPARSAIRDAHDR